MKKFKRRLCLTGLLLAIRLPAAEETGFTEAEAGDIKAFLQENFKDPKAGMVVALIDKGGGKVMSAGKLGDGTDQEVNGDTLFEIGPVTTVFTSLLALDLAARGKIRLEDPVARYLPASVKMPTHGKKEITLLQLAAHDSGLPFDADNYSGEGPDSSDSYTVKAMYSFLSGYQLTVDPGTKYEYSRIGMSLLGHVVELKGGANFEFQVVNRICRPLGMDSTCITLTSKLKERMAVGHDENGNRTEKSQLQVLAPSGALLSTANDLAKFVASLSGLTPTDLKPLLEKMQKIRHQDPYYGRTGLSWFDRGVYQPPGMDLLGCSGSARGSSAFVGFDRKQRRGVVVLANQRGRVARTDSIGWRILQRASLKGQALASLAPAAEFIGIGARCNFDRDGSLLIMKVTPGSPAEQAGLTAGLHIHSIDGADITGKSLDECLKLIRGPAGTKVKLGLFDPEKNQARTVELKRQKVRAD
jgi:serine-type D-Ala-D-Ala carboxypeptidase/endopeptidase